MRCWLLTWPLWLLAVALPLAPGPIVGQEDEAGAETEATADAAFREAAASVDADLEQALADLAAARARIAEEKPPLARDAREQADALRDKRRRAELARQQTDALLHDLRTLTDRVKLWRDEAAYIDSLLDDFQKERGANLGMARFQEAAAGGGATATAAPLELVAETLEDLGELQQRGSWVGSGSALDEDGVMQPGTFVEVGPVTWFLADNGEAGLTLEGRDLRPAIVAGSVDATALRTVVEGGTADLHLDPTLGAALALDEVEGGMVERIRQGGLWIYPILLLAIVALVVAMWKWIQIARLRDLPPALVRQAVAATRDRSLVEEIDAQLAGCHHPAAALLRRGLAAAGAGRSTAAVEEELYEEFIAAQPPLQRGLPLIAIASATAPLLGLLGTVTGMIATFQRIRIFGTSDTNVIAGGISEALVTTMFGLAVAIPALIVHALLSRRIQGILSSMEMTSLAFINGLGGEAEAPGEPVTREEARA